MTQKISVVDFESFKKLQETKANLRQAASFPYSEDLRSVMDTEIYTCYRTTPLKRVLKDIAARHISSAIIVDSEGKPTGILTERDIMQRVVTAENLDTENTPVAAVMTANPITLSPGDTIYRALSVLSAKKIKHLPLEENGQITGMVTLSRLLKLRYPEPMSLMEGIRTAPEIATLREIKKKLPAMAESHIIEGRRSYDIVVMISLLNQDIHRRALELILDKVGVPPAPFCMYVTGSHGRLENLLTPDQDHGMIIADREDEQQYSDYYIELTTGFSEALAEIGFETCTGYIMSSNPLWRKSLKEWKLQIKYWFDRQVRELGRFSTVLFDATPIFGDNTLFKEMHSYAHRLLQQHHEVLRVLLEEQGRHKVPIGLLGQFLTERNGKHRGKFDIKRSGLLFVVEAIRILALLHGIRETATLKRITALVRDGFIHPDDGEYFEAAYLFLLRLALIAQVDHIVNGSEGTFINPKKLSRRERESLKHAFKAVSALQDLVATEFGDLVF
jgi:CBS domain-containing protein